jgi:hypothetical protein
MEKFKYLVIEVEYRNEMVGRYEEESDLEIEEFCNKLYEEKIKEEGLEEGGGFEGVGRVEDYYYEIILEEERGYDVYRVG